MRQIEIAELMCAADNFSVGYVKCLVATATAEHLSSTRTAGKEVRGLSPEDVARMEQEMESQAREFRLIEESHGKNTLHLTLAVGYLRRLMENARVSRYLSQRHPELHAEFQTLIKEPQLTAESPKPVQ